MRTLKRLFSLLAIILSLTLTSCGGGDSSGGSGGGSSGGGNGGGEGGSGGGNGGGGDTLYTVYFYDNAVLLTKLEVKSGEISLPTLTKDGYTFNGWLLNGEGEPLRVLKYTITANTSFVAKWTANIPIVEYTVTFYDGGVLLPQFSQTVESGMEINLPPLVSACSPFEGWLLGGSGQPFTGSYKVNGDLRFDAKFTEPVNISTPQELYNIRNDLSGKYRLTNDISLSDYSTGWNPIGDAANPFIGCLDGNGFKITYLFVDVTSRYGGLFGYINGGEIGNIGVEADSRGVNASGNISYAGIIAGYVSNDSSITDSYATGDVTATATLVSYAGGLVGYMSGIITNSYATGDVTATTTAPTSASNAGGLVGSMYYGSITDSYAIGDVTATATSNNSIAGGLVGAMEYSSITDSYATGDVTAGRFAGGLVGGMIGSITDSYATGDVTAGRFAGGLVGMMADGSITDSYATGYVTATASYSRAGGLVGEMRNGWIINSVAANLRVEITQGTGYIGRIVGDIYSGGSGTNNFALDAMQAVGGSFDTTPANHGEDKTEAQLKDQSTYETGLGWEFGNRGDPIWKMPSGGGYPILYWQ